jgi:hypothetical protein
VTITGTFVAVTLAFVAAMLATFSSAGLLRSSALVLVICLPLANAFYLPGAAPHNYVKGDRVNLLVNALTPMLPGTDDAKLVRAYY